MYNDMIVSAISFAFGFGMTFPIYKDEEQVKQGQPLIEFDIDFIKKNNLPVITLVRNFMRM